MSPVYIGIVCHTRKMRITMVISARQTGHPASITRILRIAQDSQNRACPHGTSAKPTSQHVAPRGTLRINRQRLMQLLRCRFRRPWSCRCWHGRLAGLILAAAAVVVPRLQGLRMSADISTGEKCLKLFIKQCSNILNNTWLIVVPLKSSYVVALYRQC